MLKPPRRHKKRLSALAAVLAAVAGAAAIFVTTGNASATDSSNEAFRSIASASNPDWMKGLPDATSIGHLSIPGTHESLAIHGGDAVQAQEDKGNSAATLDTQLNAGIRAFDIRVRVIGGAFVIHHGVVFQNANFGDVLQHFGAFLTSHPGETILMRLKAECTGETFSCTDDPSSTSDQDRVDILNKARDTDPNGKFFFAPSITGTGAADMPTLGAVRGKIVLTQFIGTHGGTFANYGLSQLTGSDAGNFIQDDSNVPTVFNIGAKADKVKNFITKTNQDSDPNKMYVNFLSGVSAGAFPFTVAGGTGVKIGDVGGAGAGVNKPVLDFINGGNANRTGILMMDFPGSGLINAIIARNG